MGTRAATLRLTNTLLFLSACALVGTGLLLEVRLDEDEGTRRLMGMDADDWGEIHLAAALTFAALLALHLALNRAWIRMAWRQPKTLVLLAGLGTLLVTGPLLWPGTPSRPDRGASNSESCDE
jgi:hypothetical protein